MNKSDLIDAIASDANLIKADAGRVLNDLTQSITVIIDRTTYSLLDFIEMTVACFE